MPKASSMQLIRRPPFDKEFRSPAVAPDRYRRQSEVGETRRFRGARRVRKIGSHLLTSSLADCDHRRGLPPFKVKFSMTAGADNSRFAHSYQRAANAICCEGRDFHSSAFLGCPTLLVFELPKLGCRLPPA